MSDDQIEQIIAQLDGRRDKHIIAHAYNCRDAGNGENPITINVGNRKKSFFRRLGLIDKHPGHADRTVNEADHVLTELGLEVGKTITNKFKLALARI
jgi:hypothetical protein